MRAGDVLTAVGETSNEEEFLHLLTETVGELLDRETVQSQHPQPSPSQTQISTEPTSEDDSQSHL